MLIPINTAYSFNYEYEYKINKDGSFEYEYEVDFDEKGEYSEQMAYNIGYQNGQTDKAIGQFNPTSWLYFDDKKLIEAYEDGYKEGHSKYNNDKAYQEGYEKELNTQLIKGVDY